MICPECHGRDCIQIAIRLHDADNVQFRSCRRCEAKWWENESGRVALDEVLGLAAKR